MMSCLPTRDGRRSIVSAREIFQQLLQPFVALLRLAQVGFGVEINVAEHAFQLGLVGIFDLLQRHVDQFADVRLVRLAWRA